LAVKSDDVSLVVVLWWTFSIGFTRRLQGTNFILFPAPDSKTLQNKQQLLSLPPE
jgi:hypothetical protein